VGDAIIGELRVGMLGQQRGYALFQITLPACGLIRIDKTTVMEQVALVDSNLNILTIATTWSGGSLKLR